MVLTGTGCAVEFVGSEKELELEAFRMAFRMASRGEANWRVARDEGDKLLEILCRWLEARRRTWIESSKVSRA